MLESHKNILFHIKIHGQTRPFFKEGVKIRNMSERDNEHSIGLCNDQEVRSITPNGPSVPQRSIFHGYTPLNLK